MKLASLKEGGRDGTLVVVSRGLGRGIKVPEIATTFQQALDQWDDVAPKLQKVYDYLNTNDVPYAIELNPRDLAAPLPRAYQWLDGSAYLNHVELARKARGATMPENFLRDPLMYQGASDSLVGPMDPIVLANEAWGIDCEAEIAVITDDVPMGVSPKEAAGHIKCLMLVNDVSLRNVIPDEIAKGFGFVQGKPATAFSPVAVTPDELGDSWKDGKIHLALVTHINGELFGHPNAGEDMQFNFPTLVAHAAKTRFLEAGSIIGSGTVSNKDRSRGSSCLAEKRMLETLDTGKATTPFLQFGDHVRIEMFTHDGDSIFGAISQEVMQYRGRS